MVEFGEEPGRSGEARRTKSDMVGEMADTIWRRGDHGIARPATQAAHAAPGVGFLLPRSLTFCG
jgi:hypothetical protein